MKEDKIVEKRKEELEKLSKDELIELVIKLERDKDRIINFMGRIAHDLRSLITIVVGFSKRILRKSCGDTTDNMARELDMIAKNCLLMEDILVPLFEMSANNENPLKISQFELKDLRDSIEAAFLVELDVMDIKLILPDYPVTIVGDRARITRICLNLVGNAKKYGGKGVVKRIEFNCVEDDQFWTFSVYNNGRGIPKKDCERIFESYARGDNPCDDIVICTP